MNNKNNYKFNINDIIKVKLTDLGYQVLVDDWNWMIDIIPNWKKRDIQFFKDGEDKDGYISFQLWKFMQKFGSVTKMGMKDYYSSDIIIQGEDLSLL